MTTTPTTSLDARLRTALLDVIHAQWRELGVPFHAPEIGHPLAQPPAQPLEVIDPEALLWCSLHFFAGEPRLEEAARSWFAANRTRVNTQRLNTLLRDSAGEAPEPGWIAAWRGLVTVRRSATRANIGAPSPSAATLHLRARDVLGNSCAAHLIVALLGSPRGVRCRAVADATGFTYRAIANLATSWANAGVARFDHGFCTIIDPTPWARILRVNTEEIVTVDWHAAYGAVLGLLDELRRAREGGLADTHPLLLAAAAKADRALEAAAAGVAPARAPAIAVLRRALLDGAAGALMPQSA